MKNRTLALLMSGLLFAGLVLSDFKMVYAEPENQESSEVNNEINAEELITQTQQNAMDNKVDADEDILEDVAMLIPEETERVLITNAEDLKSFSKNCSLDTWSANKYVVLENDIVLSDKDFKTIPSFSGVFDGQGHTISGYVVNDEESNIGFFAYLTKKATVKNLNLGITVLTEGKSNFVGGLCGHNSGIIRNCRVSGYVEGCDYIGGLAGINELSGIITDSQISGFVSGNHFVGGICGENMGNILRCVNKAEINSKEKEVSKSLDDINFDYYISILSLNRAAKDEAGNSKTTGDIVDIGGICGISIGVLKDCVNEGKVGYEKVGYNIGGIVGRQSGYLSSCENRGEVLGRKDIGGIAGQAEPYVTVDFSQDVVIQLSDNIGKLHDIISVTLNDADAQSDVVSNRLSVIQNFTNGALQDTAYLSDSTITWVDGMVGEANKAVSRIDYILDEAAKKDGVLDKASSSAEDVGRVGEALINTIDDMDITQYLSEEESEQVKSNLEKAREAREEYLKIQKKIKDVYTNYYRDKLRDSEKYKITGIEKDGVIFTEANMWPVVNDERKVGDWTFENMESLLYPYEKYLEKYEGVSGWIHYISDEDIRSYPAEDEGGYRELDMMLEEELIESYGSVIATKTEAEASSQFLIKYGQTPSAYFGSTLVDAADILYDASDKMGDALSEDSKKSIEEVKRLSGDLKGTFKESKAILDNVNSMEDISILKLGDDYRSHATSLNNNLQGMSDNFGFLNQEMNSGSDTIIKDLSAVNDQFNVIMQLYTDAIDGVLDKDYSNTITDDSETVAENSVDATIENCVNYGAVKGSLCVAGIVGSMAVEYDYDLESDVTGIKDANMNTTYLTKCVLRENTNRGVIDCQKSYVGGVCGLQEIGIILRCGNFSKIESKTGDYVGGIAGSSLSDIMSSYEKSVLLGGSYVGGIVGSGSDVSDCMAMPNIKDAKNFYGAIAGYIRSEGVVRNNYFVSDELAGIDRVSYSKKAEPVPYNKLSFFENINDDFKTMQVRFLLTEEIDGKDQETVIAEVPYMYGAKLAEDNYPMPENKEGYYIKWDIPEVETILCDMDITAEYVRYYTTLASDAILDNGQSQVLVDGHFIEGDEFEAVKSNTGHEKKKGCIEYWDLTIPGDDLLTHQIRYRLTEDNEEKIEGDFEIYVFQNGSWQQAELGKMGEYTTFNIKGNTPKFQVVSTHKEIDKRIIIAIYAVVAVIALIVLLIITVKIIKISRRNKKRK